MELDKIDKIRCEICGREFGSQEAVDAHNNAKHAKHHTLSKEKIHTFPIKTVSIISIIILAIIGFAAFGIAGHNSQKSNGDVINTPGKSLDTTLGDVQTAKLSVTGSSYVLVPSTFKKDIPVKIIADAKSLPGCSKTVTIPAFNVFKYVSDNDNIISFTPTKTGTFKIACSMSMYTGTFTVE